MKIVRNEIYVDQVEGIWSDVQEQSVVDIRRQVHYGVFEFIWGDPLESVWKLMGNAK